MPSVNCSYLDGTHTSILEVGTPEDTLLEVLRQAKRKGLIFGYGVLKVDGETKSLADLEKPVGTASRIDFIERERTQPIDLDSI